MNILGGLSENGNRDQVPFSVHLCLFGMPEMVDRHGWVQERVESTSWTLYPDNKRWEIWTEKWGLSEMKIDDEWRKGIDKK